MVVARGAPGSEGLMDTEEMMIECGEDVLREHGKNTQVSVGDMRRLLKGTDSIWPWRELSSVGMWRAMV